MERTKIKVEFPKGISTIHIPFRPMVRVNGESPYDELRKEIERVVVPRSARFIRAQFEVVIDLRKVPPGLNLSREGADIMVEK